MPRLLWGLAALAAAGRVAAELDVVTINPADGRVRLISQFCFAASTLDDARTVFDAGGVDPTGRAAQFKISHDNNDLPANRVRIAVYDDASSLATVLAQSPDCARFGNGSLLARDLGKMGSHNTFQGVPVAPLPPPLPPPPPPPQQQQQQRSCSASPDTVPACAARCTVIVQARSRFWYILGVGCGNSSNVVTVSIHNYNPGGRASREFGCNVRGELEGLSAAIAFDVLGVLGAAFIAATHRDSKRACAAAGMRTPRACTSN